MAEAELLIKIQADIDALRKDLKKATDEIESFGKEVKQSSKQSEKAFINLSSAAEVALGVGVANLATKAADSFRAFVVDSVRQGLKFQQAMDSLDMITRGTARSMLQEMRTASRGMVDDFTLVQGSARALSFGINQSLVPGLAQTAVALSRIQGTNASDAFNDIVTGIARGSPQILDNLGIIVDAEDAYKKYADAIGKTVDQLSKLERQQAIASSVIESSSAIVLVSEARMRTAAAQVEQYKAQWANFVTNYGDRVINVLSEMFMTIDGLTLSQLRASDAFQASQNSIQSYSNLILDTQTNIKSLSDELTALKSEMDALFSNASTGEDVKAQRELNKLQRDRLALQQAYTMQSDGSVIVDAQKEKLLKEQYNLSIKDLYTIDERIKQKQLEVDLARANARVITDELRPAAEEAGLIQKQYQVETTAELRDYITQKMLDFQNTKDALTTQRDLQKEYKDQLEFTLATQKDITDEIKKQNEEFKKRNNIPTSSTPWSSGGGGGSSSGGSSNPAFRPDLTSGSKPSPFLPKKNDFIMRPGQQALPFSKDDTIVGVKDTGKLGGSNVTYSIVIERVYGTDPDEIAQALQDKLNLML